MSRLGYAAGPSRGNGLLQPQVGQKNSPSGNPLTLCWPVEGKY